MTTFLADTFTGADTTALTAHNANTGGAGWTKHPISAGNVTLKTNRAASDGSEGDYYHTATPGAADYDVQADVFVVSNVNYGGVVGRLDTVKTNGQYYGAGYDNGSGVWELFRVLDPGGYTRLTSSAATLSTSTSYTVKLSMSGSSLSVAINATPTLGPTTDSNITATGKVGIYTASGVASGYHVDNLSGVDATGGGGGLPPGLGPSVGMEQPSMASSALLRY